MIEEIFHELANHMMKGILLHQELIHYYDFLHLCGYKKCHEYHYLEENQGYRKLYHYYVKHYNKLIELENVERPNIIPDSWYKHKKKMLILN